MKLLNLIPTSWLMPIAGIALVALAALAGTQTWRLHTLQAEYATLKGKQDADRADRATAYANDSDQTAKKEQDHAADTIHAGDEFNQGAPARADALRTELGDAQRVLDAAASRAARYRAQAEADAKASGRLADRAAALDRSLAEGRVVVAELRGVVERRDAEVKLLADLLDADDKLLSGSEAGPPDSVER